MEQNGRKANLLNLAMTLPYWLLCAAGTAVGIWVYGIGHQQTGNHTGGGLIASEAIKMSPFWAITGTVLAAAAVTAVWFLLLRGSLNRLRGQHWGWYAAWFLLFAACVCAHGVAVLFVFIYRIGLFVVLRPEWTEGLLLVPIFLPAVYLAVHLLGKLISYRKNAA